MQYFTRSPRTLVPWLGWSLCLCLLLAFPPIVQAQSLDELLTRAHSMKADINTYAEEAAQLEGEQQESLRLRNTQRYLELLKVYDDIADRLVRAREAGESVAEPLADISPLLLSVGPEIRTAIGHRREQFDQVSTELDALSPEWQLAFKEHHAFIDQALNALARHVRNLNRLSLDSAQSTHYLREALPQRAEIIAGLVILTQKDIQAAEYQLNNTPDDANAKTRLQALEDKLATLTGSLRQTVALLEAETLDASRYKELLIRTTGDITTDILDIDLLKRMGKAWWDKSLAYVMENGVGFLFKLLIFLTVLLVFHYFSRVVRRVLRKSLRRATMPVSSLMEDMLVNMASRLVMLIGILVALGQLGFSLGPILAGLGVAGFIVGFALQDTLGNFASGMMILIYRPYDVGDMIEAAGVQGWVQRMNLVSTTILTIDNQTLMVPNNKIWGDVIRNVTAQKQRRVDMVFGVSYSDDIEHTEKVLNDILAQHPKVLDEPEPMVRLHTLNDSSVDFVVRPWVNTEDYWDVYWDITRTVKLRFDAEGISIPFPQRDVHLYAASGGNEPRQS